MFKGELYCPKCHSQGMSDYLYYESRTLFDGINRYIFYNIETESDGWICWSLLSKCGFRIHHWYDPCGCCFNPCDVPIVRTTYMDGHVEERGSDVVCAFQCAFFIFLCYFIYCFYFMFFIWFDIFFCFCSVKTKRIICVGAYIEVVYEGEDIMKRINFALLTEQYWTFNFPMLFKCNKCGYFSKTFRDFMDLNQRPFPIVNNQNVIPTTERDVIINNNLPNNNNDLPYNNDFHKNNNNFLNNNELPNINNNELPNINNNELPNNNNGLPSNNNNDLQKNNNDLSNNDNIENNNNNFETIDVINQQNNYNNMDNQAGINNNNQV